MERRVFWISTFESCVLNAEIPFTRSNAPTRCTKTTSSNCFVIRNNPELGNGATFSQGQMELLITLLLLLFTTYYMCLCVVCTNMQIDRPVSCCSHYYSVPLGSENLTGAKLRKIIQ